MKNMKRLSALFVAVVASLALFAASCSDDVVPDVDWTVVAEGGNVVFTFNAPVSLSMNQVHFAHQNDITPVYMIGSDRKYSMLVTSNNISSTNTTVSINADGISSRPRSLTINFPGAVNFTPAFHSAIDGVYTLSLTLTRGLELKSGDIEVLNNAATGFINNLRNLRQSNDDATVWLLDYDLARAGAVSIRIKNQPGVSAEYATPIFLGATAVTELYIDDVPRADRTNHYVTVTFNNPVVGFTALPTFSFVGVAPTTGITGVTAEGAPLLASDDGTVWRVPVSVNLITASDNITYNTSVRMSGVSFAGSGLIPTVTSNTFYVYP